MNKLNEINIKKWNELNWNKWNERMKWYEIKINEINEYINE